MFRGMEFIQASDKKRLSLANNNCACRFEKNVRIHEIKAYLKINHSSTIIFLHKMARIAFLPNELADPFKNRNLR